MQKDYLMSLLALIHHLSVKGIKFVYSIQSSSHVADAREQTLQGSQSMEIQNSSPFLGNIKYKKILWIDSDITFTTDDFDKLWESDKDIVGGMYLLTSGWLRKECLSRCLVRGSSPFLLLKLLTMAILTVFPLSARIYLGAKV